MSTAWPINSVIIVYKAAYRKLVTTGPMKPLVKGASI